VIFLDLLCPAIVLTNLTHNSIISRSLFYTAG